MPNTTLLQLRDTLAAVIHQLKYGNASDFLDGTFKVNQAGYGDAVRDLKWCRNELTGLLDLPTHATSHALNDVLAERARQDAKWGEQNHDPFTYLAVLTEEVGELAQAALHARFGGPAADGLRDEAVQVAAVALAIVQCLDRCKWLWSVQQEATPNA